MISREQIAQEYINIIDKYYPFSGQLLRHCLIKVLAFSVSRRNKSYYYLGIYYPKRIKDMLLFQQDVFRDAADHMGLVEVVFFNASNLVKDPNSKVKKQDFRFWLELCWIANEAD